jgi:hypothetical protein
LSEEEPEAGDGTPSLATPASTLSLEHRLILSLRMDKIFSFLYYFMLIVTVAGLPPP